MKGRTLSMVGVALLILVMGVSFVFFRSARIETEKSTWQLTSIESIPESYWKVLAEKKIFFGHQSVGQNVIEGIIDVMSDHPEIELNIVQSSDLASVEDATFIHNTVGRNTRPISKLNNFERIMNSGGSTDVDIAFLKFCYVDIRRDSDAQEVFDRYHSTFSELGERFQDTTFVHFTVPIGSGPVGLKDVVKGCIKTVLRIPGVLEDNSVRQRYNALLCSKYSGNEPVFDIARYEAISPEGLMSYRMSGSERVYLMEAQYSNDGGHLNKLGRRVVAEQLLITLAEAANGRGLSETSSPR